MTHATLHFHLGPVQGWVASARRTRDLWAGSWLLSYLSGCAMQKVRTLGGDVVVPAVADGSGSVSDPLLAWIEGDRSEPPPLVASLVNVFEARFEPVEEEASAEDRAANAGRSAACAVSKAWAGVAGAVWDKYVDRYQSHGDQTREIWRRQVNSYWDTMWVVQPVGMGDKEAGGLLEARKNWRTHRFAGEEGGDKGGLMGDLQELSGYTSHESPASRRARLARNERISEDDRDEAPLNQQNAFWKALRDQSLPDMPQVGSLNLPVGERLSAMGLVKRLFPLVADKALAATFDPKFIQRSWPSMSFLAAAPWIVQVADHHPQAARRYAVHLFRYSHFKNLLAETSSRLPRLENLGHKTRRFAHLDGNCFHAAGVQRLHRDNQKNKAGVGGGGSSTSEPTALLGELRTLQKLRVNGKLIGPACPYYALLLLDGDRLGALLSGGAWQKPQLSKALAAFTDAVEKPVATKPGNGKDQPIDGIIARHGGRTVYAGGDDLLALLPLTWNDASGQSKGALECAAALAEAYQSSFQLIRDDKSAHIPANALDATCSVALVLADYRTPLRAVIHEAHRLLDEVAKEANGRSSLAAMVWKPSGKHLQWVSSWKRQRHAAGATANGAVWAVQEIADLRKLLNQGDDRGEFSATLTHGLRDEVLRLSSDDAWEPGRALKLAGGEAGFAMVEAVVMARYRASIRLKHGDQRREPTADEAQRAVAPLMELLRPSRRDEKGAWERDEGVAVLDAVMLAHFLNNPRAEEA